FRASQLLENDEDPHISVASFHLCNATGKRNTALYSTHSSSHTVTVQWTLVYKPH
ncbi:hypothetical protein JL09_g5538, partial [Pichia kudriavzevii]